MIIDAHHPFWNPRRIPQPWMTAEHVQIDRAFEPAELEPLLGRTGVGTTVLVQSAPSDDDTDYMFELAPDWVGGIVAWCRLDDADVARRRLDALAAREKFRGIRHLIHLEADPHWIVAPAVEPGLALLEERGVPLDLPAVFPNHLEDVPELARRHPGLTLVVDHLGKPPIGAPEMASWEEQLRAAADRPNVAAKVSGLNTCIASNEWTADDLEPAVRIAVDAFGAGRLMCGSDWPVALLNGTYERVWAESIDVVTRVAGADAPRILRDTARELYRLGDVP
jgi:L-fuconolactonase